jgi:hypothetical protein
MANSKRIPTKSASVTKLLSRERGATIAEMARATGWKDHSVRAFLTGVRKARLLIKEERSDGITAYRLDVAHAPAAIDEGSPA